MKPKNLVPLVVILAILAVLVMVRKVKEESPGIVEQVGLVALLPEGLTKGDVAKVELYVGTKPDEKVILTWDAESDKWRVESHFNAPVKEDKIEECLDTVVELQGEFRSSASSDADLESYNLTDGLAFHVLGYRKDSDSPAFHVLVGKSPAHKAVFMRADNKTDVFVEDSNLRRLAGLYGDDTDKTPEPDIWLDKRVLDFDKEKIKKVALTWPDKELVFELQPKHPEPEEEQAEGEEEEAESGEEVEEKEEPEVEHEWVLAKGGLGGPHKQSGLDSLLAKLDSLTATDIVDPTKKAEWGLELAWFKCVVSLEDDPEDVVIEGGRPEPGGDGYVRVANDPEDIVYKLSKYTFNQLWPKGGDLFDLPKLDLDKASIERIELNQPEGKAVLVKKDDKWTVAAPSADLDVLSTTLDTIARTLAKWKAEDYADSPEGSGLDAPGRTTTFTTTTGQSHTIALGADSKHIDGVYARLDDAETALVMARRDVEQVLVAPNDLYDRTLFDFDEEDISSVQVRRDEDTFLLERKDDDVWNLVIEGTSFEADSSACDSILAALADLEATEIVFGKTALEGETTATISLTLQGGGSHTITLGAEHDGAWPATLAGKKQLFLIASTDAKSMLPSGESLKKPEPEPEPEEAPEPSETPSESPETTHSEPTVAVPEPESETTAAAPDEAAQVQPGDKL